MYGSSTILSYSNTSTADGWWLRYPYYTYHQPFSIYIPSKDRTLPKEETQQMTAEEFDTAFNDLLFGGKQEEANV